MTNTEVAIVKYNAGNIQSVLFALERIGVNARVSDDAEVLQNAPRVIFPGVGEAGSAMRYLRERGLDEIIINLRQPVLGICLGMQLLCKHSEENDTKCLGIFPVFVKKFDNESTGLKIPQIGWNNIFELRSPLFNGIGENSYVYHVHSYYAEQSSYSIANCNYGINYSCAVNHRNFYGVQFHTEKSSASGERILKNFMSL